MPRSPAPPFLRSRPPDPDVIVVLDEIDRRNCGAELRRELWQRVVGSVFAIAVVLVAAFILTNSLLQDVRNLSSPYRGFEGGPPEVSIALYFKAVFYLTLGAVLPVTVAQFFGYLAPDLDATDKRLIVAAPPLMMLLFASGVLLAVHEVAPRLLALRTG